MTQVDTNNIVKGSVFLLFRKIRLSHSYNYEQYGLDEIQYIEQLWKIQLHLSVYLMHYLDLTLNLPQL